MILGTAGHVDHGKTALVRALTGVDTDRLPEERRRGITIELGFAPLTLPDGRVAGVVDVPGHEAFVRTMVAGASGIDVALLVIAADEGVMPQTREHLHVLELLGVRRAVVALTKCDLAQPEWLALVRDDVVALLADTPFGGAPVIETSVVANSGLPALVAAIADAVSDDAGSADADAFRLPVDRVFTVRGTGTVVTGTAWGGTIERDSRLRVLPGQRVVRVRAIESHGQSLPVTPPRARVALALVGIEPADVPRGSVLVSSERWLPTSRLRADARLLAGTAPLGPRTVVRFHHGTSEVGARLASRDPVVTAGGSRSVRIVLDAPVVAQAGDRFVLRGGPRMATIGGGIITDPLPPGPRARPGPPWSEDAERRLAAVLEQGGEAGVAAELLPQRVGVGDVAMAELLTRLRTYRGGGRVLGPAAAAALRRRLVAAVQAHHLAQPLEAGISVQTLRARAGHASPLVQALLQEAADEGELVLRDGLAAVVGHRPSLTTEQATLADRLVSDVVAGGAEPPTPSDLSARHGVAVALLLGFLHREGRLTRLGDRDYDPRVVSSLMERLRSALAGGGSLAPAELRQRLGVSRRLLIPLLESADQLGITVRDGDLRRLASGGGGNGDDGTVFA